LLHLRVSIEVWEKLKTEEVSPSSCELEVAEKIAIAVLRNAVVEQHSF
jgi:hypothetical protein